MSIDPLDNPGENVEKAVAAPIRIRVMVVDDHHVVRAGLRAVLSECPLLEVVAEAATAGAALAMCGRIRLDVVLLDLRLPDRSGVDCCREIKLTCPDAKVLFLTSYGDEANVLAGLAAGADGYLLKTITGGDIADAVLKVAAGGAVLDPLVTRHLIGRISATPATEARGCDLTAREWRILEGVARGRLNKEIASDLGGSEKTIRNQLTAIYEKLNVKSRGEAAIFYERRRAAKGADQS